jgi:hypothetical protein
VDKYVIARQTIDDNIRQAMRVVCWMNKATGTHTEYVILMGTLKRVNVKFYIYCPPPAFIVPPNTLTIQCTEILAASNAPRSLSTIDGIADSVFQFCPHFSPRLHDKYIARSAQKYRKISMESVCICCSIAQHIS